MAFVVPGICRFTINANIFERRCANVIDMQIDTTGSIVSRPTACEEQAEVILSAWDDNIIPNVHQGYQATSVSWVDLDEADGSTGSVSSNGADVWPKAGAIGSDRTAANLAVLVTKNTTSARGIRKGRMYVAGAPEIATDGVAGNRLTAAYLTQYQNAFDAFYGAVTVESGSIQDWQSEMRVVHILTREPDQPNGNPGAPLTGNSSTVHSLSVQSLLATQRRRLRG